MSTCKAKVFLGTCHSPADLKFNTWIGEHPNIIVTEFRYQQARMGDHSIAILYKEEV